MKGQPSHEYYSNMAYQVVVRLGTSPQLAIKNMKKADLHISVHIQYFYYFLIFAWLIKILMWYYFILVRKILLVCVL